MRFKQVNNPTVGWEAAETQAGDMPDSVPTDMCCLVSHLKARSGKNELAQQMSGDHLDRFLFVT
jgi:hypothetical protein